MPDEHNVVEILTFQECLDVPHVGVECHCLGERVGVRFQAGEQRVENSPTPLAKARTNEIPRSSGLPRAVHEHEGRFAQHGEAQAASGR